MPKYEYACKSCGERLEVVQSFTDDQLTECPACGGVLRKVFSAPAISFKGKGFYRNDHRQGRPSTETKTEPKTETKTDKADGSSKPAKTESSPSSPDSKPTPKASEAKSA